MSNPLDLVLINNHYHNQRRAETEREVINIMGRRGRFKANVLTLTEDILSTPTYGSELIPPEAIVYIHGNFSLYNINFEPSLKLAENRPDLRLVIGIESMSGESRFSSSALYQTYRRLPSIDTTLTDLEMKELKLREFVEVPIVTGDPQEILTLSSDNVDFQDTPAAMQRYLAAHYKARNPK